jgi:hypothetical protein
MPSQLRLTLLCAACVATLGTPVAALAQAGPSAGAARPQQQQQSDDTNGKAVEPPAAPQQHGAPTGCPYRDGKLELIV